jgi:catechol 2,3-dioxygenase-like lactoylglutathione lyase family enzyme
MTTFARPRGLNHVAYITRDTAATTRFYTEVLGCRLVGHAQEEKVGSTGEATPFLHTFFELGDGSCIAFFDIEGLPPAEADSVTPRWAPHLALSVDSAEELTDAHHRLAERGVDVAGPVDHEGIWSSIYFFDPNDVRIELTYQNRALTEDDAAAARQAVDRWTGKRAAAR